MAATSTQWQITGEYFENCSCDVVCPCLISANAPMTSTPTKGSCQIPLAFHVESGNYGDVRLDGLNAGMMIFTPGPMAEGNWKVALYIDERADARQQEALGAILGGSAGGPVSAVAPLVGEMLGAKTVTIAYRVEGKRHSVEIPHVMHMAVRPLPSLAPDREIWIQSGHPFAPDKLAMAVGEENSTYADHGMSFDNSGKNGFYGPISWSNG